MCCVVVYTIKNQVEVSMNNGASTEAEMEEAAVKLRSAVCTYMYYTV